MPTDLKLLALSGLWRRGCRVKSCSVWGTHVLTSKMDRKSIISSGDSCAWIHSPPCFKTTECKKNKASICIELCCCIEYILLEYVPENDSYEPVLFNESVKKIHKTDSLKWLHKWLVYIFCLFVVLNDPVTFTVYFNVYI